MTNNMQFTHDMVRFMGLKVLAVYMLLASAEQEGIAPVSREWLLDHMPPQTSPGSITAATRWLTSPERQFAIRVPGGWRINRERMFQLPLGAYLPEGEKSAERTFDAGASEDTIKPDVEMSAERTFGARSSEDTLDLVFEKSAERTFENKSSNADAENSQEIYMDELEMSAERTFDNEIVNFCEVLKTPSTESLNTVVVGVNNLNLTTTTDSDSGEQSGKTWGDENRLLLEHSHLLFGEPGVKMDLALDAIPPQVVRGWLNQCYFGLQKGHFRNGPAGAAGTVYNRLRDYVEKTDPEKPKAVFLHAAPDAYLPDVFLVAIGAKRKTCERCHVQFDSLAAYEAHLDGCTWTPAEEPDHAPLEPDETITDQVRAVWGSVLETLRADMPKASFETWVQDIVPVHQDADGFTFAVRNAYACDWLRQRLKSTFERHLGRPVEFVVSHGLGD